MKENVSVRSHVVELQTRATVAVVMYVQSVSSNYKIVSWVTMVQWCHFTAFSTLGPSSKE